MTASEKPRGRPRSEEANRIILQVAVRQLHDYGYARMSIESVAAEAGVGKTTIYRRYQGKEDLASAAVASIAEALKPPNTGDTRRDLIEFLETFGHRFSTHRRMSMIGTLLVEERQNPKLLRLFRQRVILPRRGQLKDILARGANRGDIRNDLDLNMIVDCLAGSVFARYLAGLPAGGKWAQQIVDLVWEGIGASAR